MIKNYYLHTYLLSLRQVMIRTRAAMTHTALVGSIAATMSPDPKAMGPRQLLHLLIVITLYILLIEKENVTI